MFQTCLNTSTLRGYKLPLTQLVSIAREAGFDAIEPWIDELEAHEKSGGSLEDLGAQIRDAGLSVQGAIGFAPWITGEDAAWDAARRDMELVARVGGTLMAAPPMGATETADVPLELIAQRYAKLCEIGRETGVRPLVELWGFSRTLSKLGEVAFVAAQSGAANAGVLSDVYHLYKGGSPTQGLKLFNSAAMPLFHVNDYPAIAPAAIGDADRVWPGDGVAPLRETLGVLREIGFDGYLSLELFNPNYWQGEPLETAKTGREKLRALLDAA